MSLYTLELENNLLLECNICTQKCTYGGVLIGENCTLANEFILDSEPVIWKKMRPDLKQIILDEENWRALKEPLPKYLFSGLFTLSHESKAVVFVMAWFQNCLSPYMDVQNIAHVRELIQKGTLGELTSIDY